MILLNFSHPLTSMQKQEVAGKVNQHIDRIINVKTRFDEQQPFRPQLGTLMSQIDLTPKEWREQMIIVILPSLNFIVALLLAELHGRMGYFPPVVRTQPVADSLPRRYQVTEILDLQSIRDSARRNR